MQKRIIAIFLCIVMAISLYSCSPSGHIDEKTISNALGAVLEHSLEKINPDNDDLAERKYVEHEDISEHNDYTKIELNTGRKSLTTDPQRKCYDLMLDAVYNVSSQKAQDGNYTVRRVTVEGEELSNSELRLVIAAFCDDNPQIFWLDGKFGYANSGGNTILQMYSLISADDLSVKITEFNSKLKKAISAVPSGYSDYKVELFIHDYIIDNCVYAKNVKALSDDFLAFTPYGVLVNKSAVCEGYAKMFQLYLSYFGIESTNIVGTGKEELHMWTGVKINSKWYYVDVTWDDTSAAGRYDYFNITTEQLLVDHKIAGVFSQYSEREICGDGESSPVNFNLLVPICTNVDLNYYYINAANLFGFGGYYDTMIIEKLLDSANNEQPYFHIYINPESLDYNYACDELFGQSEKMFYYINEVNNRLETNYWLNSATVSIYKKPAINVVTIALEYV